jgi:hypothetical protein
LRILSETWSTAKDELSLEISGMPGHAHELKVENPDELVSVGGAELMRADDGSASLHLLIPVEEGPNRVRATIKLHFAARTKPRKR